jgi:hypothetical protein
MGKELVDGFHFGRVEVCVEILQGEFRGVAGKQDGTIVTLMLQTAKSFVESIFFEWLKNPTQIIKEQRSVQKDIIHKRNRHE